MDPRKALPPGTRLTFSGRERGVAAYMLTREIGRGASCIVYDATYETRMNDRKAVRIKECYPFGLRIDRAPDGGLRAREEDGAAFEGQKAAFREAAALSNRLFAIGELTNSISNTVDLYEANGTEYVVSTFLNGEPLSAHECGTLRECVRLVRSAADAVGHIHEAGYLYLDLKPENIFVIRGTSELIQLFDFDSMIRVEEAKARPAARISYSKGYAALEQQTGRLSRFGFHTDVYAVGAVLFHALFGKSPSAFDCDEYAEYDFSAMPFSQAHFSDALFRELTRFFHKTLSSFPPARYQTMREAIAQLDVIERCADETRPRILPSPAAGPMYCFGRERELERLDQMLRDEARPLAALCGMGGIGKSTLAAAYLSRRRADYDAVLHLFYNGSVRRMIADDRLVRLSTVRKTREETESEYFVRKMDAIRALAQEQRVLLVIDNFCWADCDQLEEIMTAGWTILTVSRETPPQGFCPCLRLTALHAAALRDLFERNLQRSVAPEEEPCLEEIIRLTDGHTLVIELIAKQIRGSFLSLQEACALMRTSGFARIASETVDALRDGHARRATAAQVLDGLLDAERLAPQERVVLKLLSLFDMPGVDVGLFQSLCGLKTKDPIHLLLRLGWICEQDARIFMHPVTRECVGQWPWQGEYEAAAQGLMEALYARIHPQGEAPDSDRQYPADYERLRTLLDLAEQATRRLDRPSLIRQRLLYHLAIDAPVDEEEAVLRRMDDLFAHADLLDAESVLSLYVTAAFIYGRMDRYDGARAALRDMRSFLGRHPSLYYLCVYHYAAAELSWNQADVPVRESFAHRDRAILAARLSHHAKAKRQLLACLTDQAMALLDLRLQPEKCRRLMREAAALVEKHTQPRDEIRYQFLRVAGFYHACLTHDREAALACLQAASRIAEAGRDSDLSWIDHLADACIPLYGELQMPQDAARACREGIRLCERHADSVPYKRKKEELMKALVQIERSMSDE